MKIRYDIIFSLQSMYVVCIMLVNIQVKFLMISNIFCYRVIYSIENFIAQKSIVQFLMDGYSKCILLYLFIILIN